MALTVPRFVGVTAGVPAEASGAAADVVTSPLAKSVLLCHFDGTNGSTTTSDSCATGHISASPKTITLNGGAQLATAQKVFGASSLLCDGVNDYASIPDDRAWSVWAGNFFVEFRYRPTTIVSTVGFDLVTQVQDANNRWSIYEYEGNVFAIVRSGGSNLINLGDGGAVLSAGTWYTIGVELHNGTLTLYRDGVVMASSAFATSVVFAGPLYVAGNPSIAPNNKPCQIDELITVRDSLHAGEAYTPETAAYDETGF
jgi:hypothetical protein